MNKSVKYDNKINRNKAQVSLINVHFRDDKNQLVVCQWKVRK